MRIKFNAIFAVPLFAFAARVMLFDISLAARCFRGRGFVRNSMLLCNVYTIFGSRLDKILCSDGVHNIFFRIFVDVQWCMNINEYKIL